MSKPPIAIIGAGLGGLALGRGLLALGIPCVIYEKASAKRRHSYAITLLPRAHGPLARLLGLDESALRSRVSVDSPAVGAPALAKSGEMRVHRARLEELMRDGLDVRWEHTVSRIDLASRASGGGDAIRLTCEPPEGAGRKAAGEEFMHECVVAADGPHSVARKEHVSVDDQLSVLPIVALNGKRRVPRDVFASSYAPAFAKAASMKISTRAANGAQLQVDVFDQNSGTVSVNWVYSRMPRGDSDTLYKPNRPNAGATDIPEDFYIEVGGLNLDQPFANVFDVQTLKGERILSWLMRTSQVPLQSLQTAAEGRLYFIGDSVHAEPILGGEGANNAISDGIELADWIANHGSDSKSMKGWYAQRVPAWLDGVEASKQRIESMHTEAQKPLL